ncbi:hypothetical protein ACLSZY_03220 [Avibacterium volantium]|uniref:hypothetical protein n=1 Tax=Avibacterium TaxID=292486 RepID=UPI0039FC7194
MKDDKLAVLSEKNKQLEKDNEALRKQLQKERNEDFIEELIKNLHILPGQRELAREIISLTDTFDESGIVTLKEGEAGLASKIKALLKSRGTIINLSMQTERERTRELLEQTAEERHKAEGEALDRDIMFYMKRHKVSYKQAFLAITKGLRGVY